MNKFLKFQKKFLPIVISLFILSPGIAMGGFWEDICGYCGINPWCWVTCPLEYGFTLIFRIPVFFFALIGVAIALIAILLGWLIVPPITNTLLALSLNEAIYDSFTGTWEVVREFSLSLVRIFLLIIGLLTIFRIREYEARKTLVSLIIAALLVSFSFPIGKKLIELGNALTNYVANKFFNVGGGENYLPNVGDIYAGLLNGLLEHFGKIWEIFTINGDVAKFFQKNLWIIILISISYWVFAFLSIYVSFVLLALGIVFLIRLLYLVCLLIVSPIAFLTAGLRTREIKQIFGGFLNWDGWWPTFLEWVFIGIVLMIWLGVGVKIFDALKTQVAGTTLNIDCSRAMSTQDPEVVQYCNDEVNLIANKLLAFVPALAAAVAIHIGVKTSPGIIKQAVEGVIGAVKLVVGAALVAGTVAIGAAAGAVGATKGAWEAAREAGASRLKALGSSAKALATEGIKGSLRIWGAFAGGLAKGLPELKGVPEVFKPGIETVEAIRKSVPWVRRPLIYEKKEAEEEIDKTLKEKGPRGVQEIAESKTASPVLRRAAIQKAMEEGFDKGKEWSRDKEMRGLILQIYEEAAKKGNKKTMGMMERRLLLSLGGDFLKRKIEMGMYTEKDIDEDVKSGVFTQEQGKLMKGLMEKVKRKEKLSTEEEKALKDLNITKVIDGVKTADDMKQLQKGWWNVPEAMEAAKHFWTGHQWGLAAREFGRELINALEPIIEEIRNLKNLSPEELEAKYGTRDVAEAYKKIVWSMPGLARFSQTTTAQEVGVPSIWELAPDEIKYQMEERRVSEAGRVRTVRVPVGRRYENLNQVLAERPLEKREAPITEEEIERKEKELEKRMKKLEK
jgi:hypothetical protein